MKTKKQRQEWWRNLSLEAKEAYLVRVQERKATKRRLESIRAMEKSGLKFDCGKCIHGLTKSCIDLLKNGCEYFFDVLNEIKGSAYAKR